MTQNVGNINRNVLYASMVLIILLGLITNMSLAQIDSVLIVYLIILIAAANIVYLYTIHKKPNTG
jgi:hypothetical protein